MATNGRFQIQLNEGPREIVISLGLRSELFRKLTINQLEFAQLQQKTLVTDDDRVFIKLAVQRLDELIAKAAEPEAINEAQQQLQAAYDKAFSNLEIKQKDYMRELALGHIEVTEGSLYDCLCLALSERDEKGKMVNEVTHEDVQWGKNYEGRMNELLDLAIGITDYLGEALKKIQHFNKSVYSISQEVSQKTD